MGSKRKRDPYDIYEIEHTSSKSNCISNILPQEQHHDENRVAEVNNELQYEVQELVSYRPSEEEPGRILIEVQWVGDPTTTWEPEENIQDDVPELLFEFWKSKGGRCEALFQKGELHKTYFMYDILGHEKQNGGYIFKIQWVGYSDETLRTTRETESHVKSKSRKLLEKYWNGQGGRPPKMGKV